MYCLQPEIEAELDGLCDRLPFGHAFDGECKSFINSKLDQLVHYLSKADSADKICVGLEMCTSKVGTIHSCTNA